MITVKKDIPFLLEIQVLDREILQASSRKRELPARLKSLKDQLASRNALLSEKRDQMKHMVASGKNLEVSLEAKQQQKQQLEVKLMGIRTNQEYKALEKEIFGMKADAAIIEEQILQNMMDSEQKQEEVQSIEEEIKQLQAQISVRETEISKVMLTIDQRLKKMMENRTQTTGNVSPSVLARYEKIAQKLPGRAVVPVEDRACQGCYMALTPQVFNDVHKDDILILCENCSRILYLPEEESSTENPTTDS